MGGGLSSALEEAWNGNRASCKLQGVCGGAGAGGGMSGTGSAGAAGTGGSVAAAGAVVGPGILSFCPTSIRSVFKLFAARNAFTVVPCDAAIFESVSPDFTT